MGDSNRGKKVVEDIATFPAYYKSFTVNNRDGELTLTFAIPEESKYEALPVTDHAGVMLVFHVSRVRRWRSSDDGKPNVRLLEEGDDWGVDDE